MATKKSSTVKAAPSAALVEGRLPEALDDAGNAAVTPAEPKKKKPNLA